MLSLLRAFVVASRLQIAGDTAAAVSHAGAGHDGSDGGAGGARPRREQRRRLVRVLGDGLA